MSLAQIALVTIGLMALIALVYWQLIIAEGAYLGPRVVAWTYDRFAPYYDGVKRFNPQHERWFVAWPLLRSLGPVRQPLVLDVATGTGRLPLTLLAEDFGGQILGLDLSAGMLRQARTKLWPFGEQVHLIQQDAGQLPFEDATFDAVTCLESLEFLPRPREALGEMVRVLAPGGVLLVTNRVGQEAPLLPGRAIPQPRFRELLAALPLCGVQVRPWQENYDLVIAHKEGRLDRAGQAGTDLSSLLLCPACGGQLAQGVANLACTGCWRIYPMRNGITWLADADKMVVKGSVSEIA
jgi:ubiquinone/menaquinone biosynthesis C-methylase UbiE